LLVDSARKYCWSPNRGTTHSPTWEFSQRCTSVDKCRSRQAKNSLVFAMDQLRAMLPGDHVSAFQPIAPRAALWLPEDTDTGVDCERLLTDLAEAGLIKGYARLQAVSETGGATSEVRDARIEGSMWKRFIAEEKIADVFGSGSVRLGGGASSGASVTGIRFDEKSVKTAAVEHSRDRQAPITRSKPIPAAPVQDVVREPIAPIAATAPAEVQIKAPRRVLAADAVGDTDPNAPLRPRQRQRTTRTAHLAKRTERPHAGSSCSSAGRLGACPSRDGRRPAATEPPLDRRRYSSRDGGPAGGTTPRW